MAICNLMWQGSKPLELSWRKTRLSSSCTLSWNRSKWCRSQLWKLSACFISRTFLSRMESQRLVSRYRSTKRLQKSWLIGKKSQIFIIQSLRVIQPNASRNSTLTPWESYSISSCTHKCQSSQNPERSIPHLHQHTRKTLRIQCSCSWPKAPQSAKSNNKSQWAIRSRNKSNKTSNCSKSPNRVNLNSKSRLKTQTLTKATTIMSMKNRQKVPQMIKTAIQSMRKKMTKRKPPGVVTISWRSCTSKTRRRYPLKRDMRLLISFSWVRLRISGYGQKVWLSWYCTYSCFIISTFRTRCFCWPRKVFWAKWIWLLVLKTFRSSALIAMSLRRCLIKQVGAWVSFRTWTAWFRIKWVLRSIQGFWKRIQKPGMVIFLEGLGQWFWS